MTSFAWVMELLDEVGSAPHGRSPRQCPAHVDAAPSLSLHERDGKLMLFCHAGCEWRRILASLRCPGNVLHQPLPYPAVDHARSYCSHLAFPKLERGTGHPALNGYRLETIHDYGGWFLERWRHPVTKVKDLMWWTKTDQGRVPGLMGTPVHELPLYREPEVRAAIAMGEAVVLVESESSVDALKGWAATTWAGGANTVPVQRLQAVLKDYDGVVCVPDVDEAGLRCAAGLRGAGVSSRMLVGRIGEDAKDLYGRLGADAFRDAVEEVMRGHEGSGFAEECAQAG